MKFALVIHVGQCQRTDLGGSRVEELLLVIKSSRELFPALKAELERIHPYEVPEILALPVVAGSENYLNWIGANVRGNAE